MDKAVIDEFWRGRAAQGSGRWTEPDMIKYEQGLLARHVTSNCHILDLGSGPASLSQMLLNDSSSLTCVDRYQGFLDVIPPDPRITKICCDVVGFRYGALYDLILLFGVVTHLEADEELTIYQKAAGGLVPEGVLVVKNQVSRFGEKHVDGYSDSLKCHYVGRYPDISGQTSRLRQFFANVEICPYPSEFEKWPDTQNFAFICSRMK